MSLCNSAKICLHEAKKRYFNYANTFYLIKYMIYNTRLFGSIRSRWSDYPNLCCCDIYYLIFSISWKHIKGNMWKSLKRCRVKCTITHYPTCNTNRITSSAVATLSLKLYVASISDYGHCLHLPMCFRALIPNEVK